LPSREEYFSTITFSCMKLCNVTFTFIPVIEKLKV